MAVDRRESHCTVTYKSFPTLSSWGPGVREGRDCLRGIPVRSQFTEGRRGEGRQGYEASVHKILTYG